MPRKSPKPKVIVDGARALTELLDRLPDGATADAIREEVGRLRRLAVRARPRRKTERARLLDAIEDADRDYQAALADGSHQAADRVARRKIDLERTLRDLDAPPPPARAPMVAADPATGRVAWLSTHLQEIEADLQYLRATERWALIPLLDARAAELRSELDDARAADGEQFVIGDSPTEVAARLMALAPRLRELADLAQEDDA